MTLLINSQNNNPISFSLSKELQSPQGSLSSEDFLSRAITIVKTGAQEETVEQIAMPLQVLRQEYAGEVLSSATCRALIEKIKDTDVCAQHLPIIYRHLILDLRLRIDDLSTCNEEFRIAKARLDAQRDGRGVSENIQNYGIKDEAVLVEIAKLAAQQDGRGCSKNIQNYGIKSEAALVEIAKLVAKQYGQGVSKYIQNYAIQSEAALVEIAKLAAQQNGEGVSINIENYGIQSEEARIEIAKLAAQQNGQGVSEYIQNYGIQSEAARIEIAKLAAKQNGQGVSEHIQNYGIQSEEARIEIAKLAAKQNGQGVSEHIQNYGIQSEAARIEIAKLAAQQSGWGAVSKYIQNYVIKSEAARIEIAKLAAQQSGCGISGNIQNYDIKSEAARIEIAKLAAQQSGWGVSENIQNYSIKNEAAVVEIAKLAAQQDGFGVSEHIQKYGIQSEATLVEIAKLAAQQSGWGVSFYIQNYSIKSEAALVEIAKLAAQQSGLGISENIEKYGIKNEAALVEIALLAIQQNTDLNSLDILNRYILNVKNRMYLIFKFFNKITKNIQDYFPKTDHAALLKQYPELRIFGLNDSPDSELAYLSEMIKVIDPFSGQRKALYKEIIEEQDPSRKAAKTRSLHVLCSIVDFANGTPALLEKLIVLFTSVQQEKNAQVQEQKLSLIAALLMHCRVKNVDQRALDEQFFLLNEMFALRDPTLRSYLSHGFIENITNPALYAFVKKHLSKKSSADLALSLLAPFIAKMNIPYVELSFAAKKTDVSENDPEIRYVPFIERMKELLNHKFFKDDLKAQILLRSLRTLVDTPQLSHAEKTSVLRDLIFAGHLISIKDHFKQDQCEQLLRSAETVALLIQCDQSNRLMSISSEQLHNQFSQLFASILKIDAPDNLIFNTLAAWRKPGSLLMYAMKQSGEGGEKVLALLQQFAQSVLNNTFASDRYDSTKASEHWLKVLEKMPPALIEKWKKGSSYMDNGFDVVDTDNPCDLLLSGTEVGSCQKVDGDPHYSKCLVAYLMDPKIRMMAVKNKQGVTIARCMMRLLWDKTTQKFALFQEKKYPLEGDSTFAKMLNQACKKRAEELGLALLVKNAEAQGEKTTLQAFKGKAPFEYVDAHPDPIQTDTGYQISGCKYIYRP